MPDGMDGQTLIVLLGAALLIYGVHAGVVGVKKGVHHVFHKNAAKVLVQPIEHPKKDLKAIIRHEEAATDRPVRWD